MSMIREVLFDWLFNASIQIGLFAILAAVLAPIIAMAKAKYQHSLYLAVLVLCLFAPAFNTLWQTQPSTTANRSQQQLTQSSKQFGNRFWDWDMSSKGHKPFIAVPTMKSTILALWCALFLYQLVRFGRGIYRVRRLRRDALPLSPHEVGMTGAMREASHRIVLLQSETIDDPVTVGVLDPAIILPRKVIPELDEHDFEAILAHECGHIQRKDFLVHLVCQLIILPVAWHPGIRYLMSKISQTRELACDEYATIRLGTRIVYARTLLRLASLCLHLPRRDAMELGIFDGDNLEGRIMMLTEKRTSLSRAGLVGLVLTTGTLFGSSTVLARAVSLQEVSTSTTNPKPFAGTWHWMFQGRSFVTMILVPSDLGITGSVTGSKIALDDNGELSRADSSDDGAPSAITKTKLEGNALHVTVGDGFKFIVTLKDATHAEIHPVGAPANMKPIQAERVN